MSEQKLENIVLVILIFLGVGLGILFRLMENNDNELSAILFSIALASILYKFLGGNDSENSLSLGAIKFGGSAAVLAGFIYLLSQFIFKTETGDDPINEKPISIEISPNDGWYPADVITDKVKPIEIKVGDSTIVYPSQDFKADILKERQFSLNSADGNDFILFPQNNFNDSLGHVFFSNIKGLPVSEKGNLQLDDSYRIIKLYPDPDDLKKRFSSITKLDKHLNKQIELPFQLNVYGGNFSLTYQKENETTMTTIEKDVRINTSYYVPSPNSKTESGFLLMILHANHLKPNSKDHYSEWAIYRVNIE